VLEIGPGPGALTAHLLERASRVAAIELDPQLASRLRLRFPPAASNLEVVEGDVLETDLGRWGPCVVAGNLPYYITSPILHKVLSLGPRLVRAVFLMQKEVAARVAASPGSRDYGLLSVQCRARAAARVLFDVSPSAFRPPPAVWSSVVLFEPRPPAAGLDAAELPDFLEFAAHCFQQKRKTLRNNLRAVYPKEILDVQPESGLRG